MNTYGNTFKEFYEETFSDVYEIYKDKIRVIGKKMFFQTDMGAIIAVEFTGPIEKSLIEITFTTATKYGIIDLTRIGLPRIFYKSKSEQTDKTVMTKILNSDGESRIQWSTPISEEDKMALNEALLQYIEMFTAILLKG